jgi:hypothetical protein
LRRATAFSWKLMEPSDARYDLCHEQNGMTKPRKEGRGDCQQSADSSTPGFQQFRFEAFERKNVQLAVIDLNHSLGLQSAEVARY